VFRDDVTGLQFAFKQEPTRPDMLHITHRHGTLPADAIAAFGSGETVFNTQHLRFQTTSATHAVYWAWWIEDVAVLVITCFPNAEEEE